MKYEYMHNKLLLLLSIICTGLIVAPAQSTDSTILNVYGKILEISQEKHQLLIQSSKGEKINAIVDDSTVFKQVPAGETSLRNAVSISFDQVGVNDNAFVRGRTLDASTVLARQIIVVRRADIIEMQDQNREQWATRGISGIVSQVDSQAKKIAVQIKASNRTITVLPTTLTVFHRYKINAVNLNDFESSNLESIKTGDQIRALGNLNSDGSEFVPEEIFTGSFKTTVGKVVSINSPANELVIKELSGPRTITVKISSDSNIRRLNSDSIKNLTVAPSNGANNSSAPKATSAVPSYNLTALLKNSPKILIADIKAGETIAVASASETESTSIFGITVVCGIELLNAQQSSNASKKQFDLGVF